MKKIDHIENSVESNRKRKSVDSSSLCGIRIKNYNCFIVP